jgi:hypothetical protein
MIFLLIASIYDIKLKDESIIIPRYLISRHKFDWPLSKIQRPIICYLFTWIFKNYITSFVRINRQTIVIKPAVHCHELLFLTQNLFFISINLGSVTLIYFQKTKYSYHWKTIKNYFCTNSNIALISAIYILH